MSRIQVGLDAEWLDVSRSIDKIPVHVRLQGCNGSQRRIIRRSESGKVAGGNFRRPIAAEEFVVEKETDLWDHEVTGNDQRSKKVVRSVVLQLQHRGLRPGQDDWFAQVLKHEAQRGTGVRQTVGPVEDDEGVEELVIPVDGPGNLRPAFGVDGAAVQELFKLQNCVPESPFVCADRRAKAPERFSCVVINHHIDRIRM